MKNFEFGFAIICCTLAISSCSSVVVSPTAVGIPQETLHTVEVTQFVAEYPSGKEALSTAYPIPTDSFTRADDFGDGFVSRLPLANFEGLPRETVVWSLVTRWLEHYQNNSRVPSAAITAFTVEGVTLLDSSLNPGYDIVSGVGFSIIPSQTPSDWGSFPGKGYDPADSWWHLSMAVGVFKDGDYYRLRLVPGWGT